MHCMKKNFAETGRGLNDNQISAIKIADAQDENFLQGILNELKKSDAEIFMGVRNGYFNLYLGGASIGKFNFDGGKILSVEIHKKHIGEKSSGYTILPVEKSPYNFKKICDNVKAFGLNSPKKILKSSCNSVWLWIIIYLTVLRGILSILNTLCNGKISI